MKYFTLFFLAFLLCVASCKKEEPDGRSSSVMRFCATHNPMYTTQITLQAPPFGIDTITIYVPSIFSPNGDGSNDYFAIFGAIYYLTTLQFTIRDSANTVVFTGDSAIATWDGMINGVRAPETTYFVSVNGMFYDGQTFNLQGSLSVLYCFDPGANCTNPVYYNVNCDTCMWGAQWDGSKYNPILPSNEFLIDGPYHSCD
jgi:gliding motility-associated-like protein